MFVSMACAWARRRDRVRLCGRRIHPRAVRAGRVPPGARGARRGPCRRAHGGRRAGRGRGGRASAGRPLLRRRVRQQPCQHHALGCAPVPVSCTAAGSAGGGDTPGLCILEVGWWQTRPRTAVFVAMAASRVATGVACGVHLPEMRVSRQACNPAKQSSWHLAHAAEHGGRACTPSLEASVSHGRCCAAGPAAELRPVLEELAAGGVWVRELDTNGNAFHSPALAPTLPALRTCALIPYSPQTLTT